MLMVSTLLSFCLVACGNAEDNSDRKEKNESEHSKKSDKNKGNSDDSHSAQEDDIPLTVVIKSDAAAEFIYEYEGDTFPDGCAVRFNDYEVSMINFGSEDYQSSLWTVNGDSMDLLEMVPCSLGENEVRFDVDMSNYGDFSFYDIDIYSCWCDYGGERSYIDYAAESVVNKGGKSDNSKNANDKTDDDKLKGNNTKSEKASNSYYLEREYSDGVNVICFHGTDPSNPSSMTINGDKITFNKVELVQNDDYYIQMGLGWDFEGYNEGEMYYDKAEDCIQLRGFAIANDYYPLDYSSSSSSQSSKTFDYVGIPYTGTCGIIYVEAVTGDGIPAEMAFDDYYVVFERINIIQTDSSLICAQCFWNGDDGYERQCEFNYIVDEDIIILKMFYDGEYVRAY